MKKIFTLLFEAEGDNVNTPESSLKMTQTKMKARQALDSVDDQIDALILRYEASSIKEEESDMSSLQEHSLKYLFEQEEPPDDIGAAGTEDEEADTEPDEPPEPVGSEEMDVKKPAENQEVPNLDLDAFASRTVRLIKNYKSLLRVEEAVGNRIKHFLDENYGDKHVQRYLEILESQYGLSFTEFTDERETQDDNFAVGAYAAGTGGSA